MKTRFVATIACVALGLGCVRHRQLDHFKIYDVAPVQVSARVELTGQFDDGRPRGAVVTALTYFANPVAKRHRTNYEIIDKSAHLTWYRIKQPRPEPVRTVRYENQFGGVYSFDIGPAELLAVPAEKREAGIGFPENLDHYKCYRVIRVNVGGAPPPVMLVDQFGEQKTKVGKPLFFCVPVRKTHNGSLNRIRNARDHLVVYAIDKKPAPRVIGVRDQFGARRLKVRQSVALAVPTRKRAWAPHRFVDLTRDDNATVPMDIDWNAKVAVLTIINKGTAAAGTFRVYLEVSDKNAPTSKHPQSQASKVFSTLAPGASAMIKIPLDQFSGRNGFDPTTLAPGPAFFEVYIDAKNEVHESDETNNHFSGIH